MKKKRKKKKAASIRKQPDSGMKETTRKATEAAELLRLRTRRIRKHMQGLPKDDIGYEEAMLHLSAVHDSLTEKSCSLQSLLPRP